MLSVNLANYLEDQGIGTVGTDIFIGKLPDSEDTTYDNAILLDDTGGVEPNKYYGVKQQTVQVLVRNSEYDTGLNKAISIRDLLHKKLDDTVLEAGGVDVMSIFALQEPTHLGMDESNRHLFTCNYVVKIRVS